MNKGFLGKNKTAVLIISLAFLSWGSIIALRGIWWDDWAWVWHYFNSHSVKEFMLPFQSLRHEIVGYVLLANFKLFEICHENATWLWNIFKFALFTVNPLLLYFIARDVLHTKTLLPEAIAVAYLVSPLINNLALGMVPYHLFVSLFFISILLTVKSISSTRFKLPYYLLAISFAAVSMAGLESIVFFDILRAAIVFYILNKNEAPFLKAIKGTVLYWLPFLFVGALVLTRVIILQPQAGIYGGVYSLKPLTAGYLFKIAHQYGSATHYLFFKAYCTVIKIAFAKRGYIIMLISAIMTFYVFHFIIKIGQRTRMKSGNLCLVKEAGALSILGLILMAAGFFPYAMVRDGIGFGVGSRHALLTNIGFCVFMPSILLFAYFNENISKGFYYALMGGFIFLGILQAHTIVKAYGNDWRQQRSFWWQFARRIPDLRDKTYLLINMPREEKAYLDGFRGSYEFAAPLNLIYAKSRDKSETDKHFADSVEEASKPAYEGSYLNNTDGGMEAQCPSFKGIKKFYPKNLIVAAYSGGHVYINEEIAKSDLQNQFNMKALVKNTAPGQIIYDKRSTDFPLRWIIEPELNDRRN